MKSITNLNVSVAGLSIPVSVCPALTTSRPSFEMADSRDMAKIKMPKINSITGEPVPPEFLCKVFNKDGTRIKVPEEALASFAPSKPDTVIFENFVDFSSIPGFYYDSFYQLYPQKGWEENYALLLEGLKYMNVNAITQSVFLNCSSILALMAWDDAIYLFKLHFDSQILPVEQFASPSVNPDSAVFKSLCDFINTRTNFFDLSLYTDSFNEKFTQWQASMDNG